MPGPTERNRLARLHPRSRGPGPRAVHWCFPKDIRRVSLAAVRSHRSRIRRSAPRLSLATAAPTPMAFRLLIAAFALALCTPVRAQGEVHPIIEAGRGAEVQELFAPHRFGQRLEGLEALPEQCGEFRFSILRIRSRAITAMLTGPRDLSIELRHPSDEAAGPRRIGSFAVSLSEASPCLEALLAALETNDSGRFWRSTAGPADPVESVLRPSATRATPTDFALPLLLFALLVVALALRGSSRRALLLLLVITGAALALRLAFSPRMLLGAWPYSRLTTIQRALWHSETLRSLLAHHRIPEAAFLQNVGLVAAALTPVAVFAHGRRLLHSEGRALAAAFLLAILPLHLRFSLSEVAFVPSLVLSSTLFALAHTATKDPNRLVRLFALAGVPALSALVIYARPLNFLFIGLLAVAMALFPPPPTERSNAGWRLAAAISSVFAGVLAFARHILGRYGEQVDGGLDIAVFTRGIGLLLDTEHNTLLNPWTTPPLALLFALAGAWSFRRKEPRTIAFLVGWFLLFLITHAYVVPRSVAMQARYHLHLVVPFVFLAALALERFLDLDAMLKEPGFDAWGWPGWRYTLVAALAASPWLHRDFIDDLAFADLEEQRFVEAQVGTIPAGCTVFEYPGHNDADARFGRMPRFLHGGEVQRNYSVVPHSERSGSIEGALPECAYYFEGLPCFNVRPEDAQDGVHPACAELRRSARWEPESSVTVPRRPYDGSAFGQSTEGPPLRLTLYRRVH